MVALKCYMEHVLCYLIGTLQLNWAKCTQIKLSIYTKYRVDLYNNTNMWANISAFKIWVWIIAYDVIRHPCRTVASVSAPKGFPELSAQPRVNARPRVGLMRALVTIVTMSPFWFEKYDWVFPALHAKLSPAFELLCAWVQIIHSLSVIMCIATNVK